MSFIGNIGPGGTVIVVKLENCRDFVPILLVRPRVILPDVLPILADNRQQPTHAFPCSSIDQGRATLYSVQALFHRSHEFAAVTASISSGGGGGIPV